MLALIAQRNAMKITYDRLNDAAYIQIVATAQPGAAAHTEACDGEFEMASINLDFDEDWRLLGIEVLGASRVLPPDLVAAAEDISPPGEAVI